jgi:hypothetical protein
MSIPRLCAVPQQQQLLEEKLKGRWSRHETICLRRGVRMHGREWVNISSYYVTTRTPQQCYTRFQAHRLEFRCLELCFNCFYVFIETLLELVFGVEIQTYLTRGTSLYCHHVILNPKSIWKLPCCSWC